MIPRYYIVAEREHDLQNPTSEAKLQLLGRRLRLGSESRVLDIASGRGGPALILAEAFGCRRDRYETLHWRAVEEWLTANPDDSDADDIRRQNERWKRTYLRYGREYLGWAIFIGWKPKPDAAP